MLSSGCEWYTHASYYPEFPRFVEGEIFGKKICFSVLLFIDTCDT